MKSLVSALLLLALLSPALATSGTSSRPGLPIAYVSLQRIAAESSDAKVAAGKLEMMRQEKTREVAAKQKSLETAHLSVVRAGGMFQGSRRVQLQAEENRQRAELQHLTEQAQADLQNLQRQLQTSLRDKINAVVDKLAKQRGVQLVLNEDTAVVWASPRVDLTTEILSTLDGAANPKPTRP